MPYNRENTTQTGGEKQYTVWFFHQVGQHPCHADAMVYPNPVPYSKAVADIMSVEGSAVVLIPR